MNENSIYLLDQFIQIFYHEQINPDVIDNLWEILNEVYLKIVDYTIACICLYGSQNYGLDTKDSDIDCQCFVFPNKENLIYGKPVIATTIKTKYGTCVIKDIRTAFNEIKKSSPNILECFSTNYCLINKDYQKEITAISNNIDEYARLSEYKLLKGLEGLWNKYCMYTLDTRNPKYYANALRVREMINRILDDDYWYYPSLLIPKELEYIKQIKNNPDFDAIFRQEYFDNICYNIEYRLKNYFNSHEIAYVPSILEIINNHQENLMMKYFKLTF